MSGSPDAKQGAGYFVLHYPRVCGYMYPGNPTVYLLVGLNARVGGKIVAEASTVVGYPVFRCVIT